MLKTLIICIGCTLIGIFSFQFLFLSTTNELDISDGLWIESSRNMHFSYFSQEPFYLEKVPNKDLLIFNQLKTSEVSPVKTYPMRRNKEGNSFSFISLSPHYPCTLSGKLEHDKIICKIICKGKENKGTQTGTITFLNSRNTLFSTTKNESINEAESQTLQNIAKIEMYNKEIYYLKKRLKHLTENTKDSSISEMILSSIREKYPDLSKSGPQAYLSEKTKLIRESQDEIDSYRRAQLKASLYGSEVELASRLSNIEWQRAIKNWHVSSPQENLAPVAIPLPPSDANAKQETQAIPQEPTPTGTQNNNSQSWWKEF